ncbi:MAG: site-specific DNA-methyltransferase, partial [Dysgonamonadaceae bacterium]|nr:site-specific DNA-methyltransferase [Dysgonamonadaceae bacterium]
SAKRLGRQYIGFELDEKYADISQKKLELVQPNYKIGDSWVSFYLGNIVTIRNNDWAKLEAYFNIPNPARTIDFQQTTLKRKIFIPKELECYLKESEIEESTKLIKVSFPSDPDLFEQISLLCPP